MNLDFSQYPELDGPIVLLIGCPSGIPRKLHFLDDVVIEANAQTVEIIDIQLEEDALWWVSPWQEESMFHIFRRYTRKSYHTILKWMESDKFDKDVREFLTGLVERASSLEQLPKNWAELVSLVIIDEQCEPRMSAYTRRVIEGWFPHAKFRASRFQGAVQPIWRDAEVTPIEEGQKPSAAEVLGWPVSQLPGLPGSFQTWGTLFDIKVEDLVRSRTAHLRERGHDKAVVDQIQGALQLYGLWLGMSYEQIEQVRQGLVPTTAVGLTPERSGAVC